MEFTTHLRAAFPSNPTLENGRRVFRAFRGPTGLPPSMASELTFGTDFGPVPDLPRPLPYAASLTVQCPAQPRMDCSLRAGLIPFQSPLLGESLLVSFPPLTNMLKFRGYSPLTRGRRFSQQQQQHLGKYYYYYYQRLFVGRAVCIKNTHRDGGDIGNAIVRWGLFFKNFHKRTRAIKNAKRVSLQREEEEKYW